MEISIGDLYMGIFSAAAKPEIQPEKFSAIG